MRAFRLFFIIAAVAVSAALLSACETQPEEMHDGYFTAEASDFSFGWKEYVTIYVNNNKILTVEYDAYNPSGFARSWDLNYMRQMNAASGTYPNKFTRIYSLSLINWQNPSGVDSIAGATESFYSFKALADAAIANAKTGNKQVALVDIPEISD